MFSSWTSFFLTCYDLEWYGRQKVQSKSTLMDSKNLFQWRFKKYFFFSFLIGVTLVKKFYFIVV